MTDDRSECITVHRDCNTLKDLDKITAQELLDGLPSNLSHRVLNEYFGKTKLREGDWSNFFESNITQYGQIHIKKEVARAIEIHQVDTIDIEVHHGNKRIDSTYTFGKDTTRVSIGIAGREKLGVEKNTTVKWRIRFPSQLDK